MLLVIDKPCFCCHSCIHLLNRFFLNIGRMIFEVFSSRWEKVKQQKYVDISNQIMMQKIRQHLQITGFADHTTVLPQLCRGGWHLRINHCILLTLKNLFSGFCMRHCKNSYWPRPCGISNTATWAIWGHSL